jgi:carboxypeptidase family protein
VNRARILFFAVGLLAPALPVGPHSATPAAQAPNTGVIEGRLRLAGPAPANPIIRMGADPMCSRQYAGKRARQELVVSAADGGLANVLVDLEGKFPATAPRADLVTLDQRGCLYVPRVLAMQVGQILQIKNSDPLLHNVHSLSTRGNAFNVSQPRAGMVYKVPLKNPDVIMRIKCDVHSWMTAYIGVEPHPYFAVTGERGAFRIAGVPAGRYSIRTWHERYGQLRQSVTVKPGQTTAIELGYTGKEQPSVARVRDLTLPESVTAAGFIPPAPR